MSTVDRHEPTLSASDVEHALDLIERQAQRLHATTGRPVGECWREAIALARRHTRRTAARRGSTRHR